MQSRGLTAFGVMIVSTEQAHVVESTPTRSAPPNDYNRMPLNRENSFVGEVWSLRGYMNPKYMITMAGDLLLS
ncbi:hypothetical protein Cs7R123_63660 [Catellatospora sp. TT07R-123]|nr:hypothetical protein Cs7R123_63660 [Catellatospora sp. TT07R-123]